MLFEVNPAPTSERIQSAIDLSQRSTRDQSSASGMIIEVCNRLSCVIDLKLIRANTRGTGGGVVKMLPYLLIN